MFPKLIHFVVVSVAITLFHKNTREKLLIFLNCLKPTAVEENSSTRTHYTAAVVEYEPKGNWQNSGQEIIALNLVHYLNFTLSAALNVRLKLLVVCSLYMYIFLFHFHLDREQILLFSLNMA